MNIQLCKVTDYLPIEKLKLHQNNPRQISREKLTELKNSIIEKGFYQPILIWKKDNTILAGNHRFLAVQELIREGYAFNSGKSKHVLPVVIEDMSDEMAEAILYETNNHYADWVEDKLADALKIAKEAGRDIGKFGFDSEYVDILLSSALADAAPITDRKLETEFDPSGDVIGERDEFESIVLSKPIYEQAVELLSQIAVGLNPEWTERDSLGQAVQALCQFAREKGVEELWATPKKSKTLLKKKK